MNDLIDSSITLTRWTDPKGQWAQDITLNVMDAEVCASTVTAQLAPYESEFEGYMGNYGNTMDRWYRRAALVVWPRKRSFAIRAEISPLQALAEVVAEVRARRGDDKVAARDAAPAAVTTLAPFWSVAVRSQDQSRYLAKALRAATVIDDLDTSSTLLDPFRVETLRRSHVKALAKLAGRHGEPWVGELLSTWFGDPRQPHYALARGEDRPQWLTTLPQLGEALRAEQETGAMVGRHLLSFSWDSLDAQIERGLAMPRPSYVRTQLEPLGKALAALLVAAATLDAPDVRDQVVSNVRGRGAEVNICVLKALHAAEKLPAGLRDGAGFAELAIDCADRLRRRLARPARADDDWSLAVPAGCTCNLCEELGAFLQAPHRTSLDWPLAEAKRSHIHDRIDSAELPVTHQTRRQGRPYVLVLTKAPTLFERGRAARVQDHADLAWLTATWDLPAGR